MLRRLSTSYSASYTVEEFSFSLAIRADPIYLLVYLLRNILRRQLGAVSAILLFTYSRQNDYGINGIILDKFYRANYDEICEKKRKYTELIRRRRVTLKERKNIIE